MNAQKKNNNTTCFVYGSYRKIDRNEKIYALKKSFTSCKRHTNLNLLQNIHFSNQQIKRKTEDMAGKSLFILKYEPHILFHSNLNTCISQTHCTSCRPM